MAAPNSAATSVDSGLPAFAKLQGQNFEYFMRKYSIILGRSTETCKVDFDLSELDGGRGPLVSRHHARIFYDFEQHHFALEVLGRNGCSIQKVSYLPGSDPVKLNSQDLIEIAGKEIYFLLPKEEACSIFATLAARARDARASLLPQSSSFKRPEYPRHSYADDYSHSNGENGTGEVDISNSYGINADLAGIHGECDKDTDNQRLLRRPDKDTEDQLLLEEEKDVVSSLVVLISDLCGPEEWVPMEKLHSELLERSGKNWSSVRVRWYRQQKDGSGSSTETEGRPWCRLLPLFRKYPEHFIMSTVTRGELTSEYVGLVPL